MTKYFVPTGASEIPSSEPQFVVMVATSVLANERVLAVTSGDLTKTDAGAGNNVTLGLANSGLTAGTYGSATQIPCITFDAKGRATSVSYATPTASAAWGAITGTLANQTDLNSALAGKSDTSHNHAGVYATASHDHAGVYEPVISSKGSAFNVNFGTGNGDASRGDHTHSYLSDAPSDSKTYGRNNATWVEVTSGGGTWGSITGTLSSQTDLATALGGKSDTSHTHSSYLTDAPSDTKYYARKDAAWAEVVSGSGAPTTCAYWTSQAESGLSAEVNLGALTTGVVYITVSGGVATPSVKVIGTGSGELAAGDDSRFTDSRTPTAHASSHITGGGDAIQTASGSQSGILSSSDWTTFNGKQNALTNPVTGTGTSSYVTYWSGSGTVTGSSAMTFDGNALHVNGSTKLAGAFGPGAGAAASDYTKGVLISSLGDTGHAYEDSIAIVGEAISDGTGTSTGVGGVAATSGSYNSRGVVGVGKVAATGDTGTSYGLMGRSQDTHAGGDNVAVYGSASGGANNYSFYGAAGTIYNAGPLTVTGTTTLATSLSGLLKATAGVVSAATGGTDYAEASHTHASYATDSLVVHLAGDETITGVKTFQGSASTAVLGAELITNAVDRDFSGAGNWTGTGWSVSGGALVHTAGANAASLANDYLGSAPVAGQIYQITATVVTTTAGTLTPSFGSTNGVAVGQAVGTLTAMTQVLILPGTGPLTFTPNATWAGSIDNISVKLVTTSAAVQVVTNSDTSVGYEARSGGIGLYCFFQGKDAGACNSSGTANVFVGYEAGRRNTTGTNNLFLGKQAGFWNAAGLSNVFLGTSAGYNNITGNSNMFIGFAAGLANISGSSNVYIGTSAGVAATTASDNVALGSNALLATTTGGSNIAIGSDAGRTNLVGTSNTFIGTRAGYTSTGGSNIFIGNNAGYSVTSAVSNVFIGINTGYSKTTGNENVFIGNNSGRYIADGSTVNTTGGTATYIGAATKASADGVSNETAIGYGAIGSGSNTVTLGNSSVSATCMRYPKFTAIKSGATQSGAGAAAGEVWKTASHATLPDNVLMIGV